MASDINPFAVLAALVRRSHGDAILIASAVMLRWYIEGKQSTDIALRTARKLLRRELIDPEIGFGEQGAVEFRSLFFGVLRLILSGERFGHEGYGAFLDGMATTLDQMSERRVVPGRVYTPTTIHGRDELYLSLLAILLANVPAEGDDNVVTGMTRMVEAESVFPEGDRSLHSVREFCRHMLDMLKTDTTGLKEATASLSGSAAFEHSRAVERLSNIFSAISNSVQSHRAKRVRELPIDLVAADRIRTGIEEALLTPPAHVEIFHDFEIVKRTRTGDVGISEFVINGLPRGVLTDPQMEWGWVNLDETIIESIVDGASNLVWRDFWKLSRKLVAIDDDPTKSTFWISVSNLAPEVGSIRFSY